MKGEDIAIKYMTRLDLITYFLFCMTTLDPELYCKYLCDTSNYDRKILAEVQKN